MNNQTNEQLEAQLKRLRSQKANIDEQITAILEETTARTWIKYEEIHALSELGMRDGEIATQLNITITKARAGRIKIQRRIDFAAKLSALKTSAIK